MLLAKTSILLASMTCVSAFPTLMSAFDGEATGPTDGDDHVSVFKKKNFVMQKDCDIAPGDSRSLCSNVRSKLSSIRVPDGMRVRLWKHNCNNRRCSYKDKMIELLDDVADFDDYDNKYTYIEVESYDKETTPHLWLKSNPGSSNKLRKARYFYPGQDIAQDDTYFGPSVLNDYDNGHRWAASLCLQKGLKLTMWDGNFHGDSHVLKSTNQDLCMDLDEIGWEGKIYSLRLEHLEYEFGPNEGLWEVNWSANFKQTEKVTFGTSLSNTEETTTTIGNQWQHSVAASYTYTAPATGGSGGGVTYSFTNTQSESTAQAVGSAFTTTASRSMERTCPDDNLLASHPGEVFWMYTWVMKGEETTTETLLEVHSEHSRCVPESEGPPQCPPAMEFVGGACV